jgi:[ribosomal protein S5]-alanine N-acetyltransferase
MANRMRTVSSTCLRPPLSMDNFAPPLEIQTPRLRLRRPLPSDVAAVFAYASDPEVVHYMDWPRSESIEAVASYLEASAEAWQSGEEWYWVVTLPDGDGAVGGAALRIKGQSADFGYVLGRQYWRLGLGTEVASAIVALALSVPAIKRVWATCDAENLASARVLEKSGLTREGMLRSFSVRPNISAHPRDALIYSKVR